MAKYSPDWVAKHYDQYGDKEWGRLLETPVDEVSLHVHTHYLKQFIRPGSRVLDVGAGAGRLTQVLANLGCRILVADISQTQLDLNREYGKKHSFDAAVEDRRRLDVCNLDSLDDASFDAVVCFGGPLSYVFERAGQAVGECKRILKNGGHFLASVMSLWGSCHRHLASVLEVPPDQNRKITDSGDLTPESFEGARHFCHVYRAGEFRDLLTQAGLEVVAMSASNCLSVNWNDHLMQIREDVDKWNELLRMELEATKEPGCLSMGAHLIAVARKP
jgi:SAM-dependent methyltransferase